MQTTAIVIGIVFIGYSFFRLFGGSDSRTDEYNKEWYRLK